MKYGLFLGLFFAVNSLTATSSAATSDYVSCMTQATARQHGQLWGSKAVIEGLGEVPSINKSGTFHFVRSISEKGEISYSEKSIVADKFIKDHLFVPFLNVDVRSEEECKPELCTNEKNYKFRHRGSTDWMGRRAEILDVKPRSNTEGLLKGQIWIDSETCLPVRRVGRLNSHFNMFVKHVDIDFHYKIENGMSFPVSFETVGYGLVGGKGHLLVNYGNFFGQENAQIQFQKHSHIE